MNTENPIIVALDGLNLTGAYRVTRALKGHVCGVKVNDLLDAGGVKVVEKLKSILGDSGIVMADPKIRDVPRTMARRMTHYVNAGADFVTIFADNSVEAMMAAVAATEGKATQAVGVTVLTSLDEEECNYIYCIPTKAGVLKFARAAVLAGVLCVVSSPRELGLLNKKAELTNLLDMTPGIRLADQDVEDQKRVDTPGAAIRAGAHNIIIGSAILKTPDGKKMNTAKQMVTAADLIMAEVREARVQHEARAQMS